MKVGTQIQIKGRIQSRTYTKKTDEGERNGRYFTDMTEDKMKRLLDAADVFSVEEMWVTSDVRPGRDEEKWLNMILRKK